MLRGKIRIGLSVKLLLAMLVALGLVAPGIGTAHAAAPAAPAAASAKDDDVKKWTFKADLECKYYHKAKDCKDDAPDGKAILRVVKKDKDWRATLIVRNVKKIHKVVLYVKDNHEKKRVATIYVYGHKHGDLKIVKKHLDNEVGRYLRKNADDFSIKVYAKKVYCYGDFDKVKNDH